MLDAVSHIFERQKVQGREEERLLRHERQNMARREIWVNCSRNDHRKQEAAPSPKETTWTELCNGQPRHPREGTLSLNLFMFLFIGMVLCATMHLAVSTCPHSGSCPVQGLRFVIFWERREEPMGDRSDHEWWFLGGTIPRARAPYLQVLIPASSFNLASNPMVKDQHVQTDIIIWMCMFEICTFLKLIYDKLIYIYI